MFALLVCLGFVVFGIFRLATHLVGASQTRSSWKCGFSACARGAGGAVLLPTIVYLLHLMLLPSSTETEGYPFIFLFVFGWGAVLGVVSGLTVGLIKSERSYQASCCALIGSSSVAGLIFLVSTAIGGQVSRTGTVAEFVTFLITLFGPIIFWIIFLVCCGYSLRQDENRN